MTGILSRLLAFIFCLGWFLSTAEARKVDLALVLLIDDSGSIDDRESRMQLSGYAAAFRSPAVVQALTRGPNQSIAVSVVMFTDRVQVMVPWKVLDGRQSANALASQVERLPRMAGSATHIAKGLQFSINHISRCPYEFFASTIDLSADGWDNQFAPPVDGTAILSGLLGAVTGINVNLPSGPDPVSARKLSEVRNYARSRGITINCIAIEDPSLRDYFSRYVMAGPSAFTTFAPSFRAFTDTIQRKLLREIVEGLKISAVRQNKPPPGDKASVKAPVSKPTPGKAKSDTTSDAAASAPRRPAKVEQDAKSNEIEQAPEARPMVVEVTPPVERRYEILVRDADSEFPIDEVTIDVLPPATLTTMESPDGRPGLVQIDLLVPANSVPRIRVSAPLYQESEVNLPTSPTEVRLKRTPLQIAW